MRNSQAVADGVTALAVHAICHDKVEKGVHGVLNSTVDKVAQPDAQPGEN